MSLPNTVSWESALDGLRNPFRPNDELHFKEVDGAIVLATSDDRHLARYVADEWRLIWAVEDESTDTGRIVGEQERFDAWAETQTISYPHLSRVTKWYDFPLYHGTVMDVLFRRWPRLRDVSNARILDIGGSCIDSWRFLATGARRIDQVEVSPASQRLAIVRLDSALKGLNIAWRGRVWFHTTPAELLPFDDATFDIVFSRATIHHTLRQRCFPEMYRVLKPGGFMLIIEPRYSYPLRWLLSLSRHLRRADRGTDDPLTDKEIRSLSTVFSRVDWYPYGCFSLLWSQAIGKITQNPRIRDLFLELDRRLGRCGGLAYLFGSCCWIVGQK